MAVHAHPDDESIGTGGVLAKYTAEGIRTVLVTCTNGELGDGPAGVKPGEEGHDPRAVVEVRRAELDASCKVLGIAHLEMLGYRDSGMMGWAQNDDPDSFWNTPVDDAAARLAALMDRYRPDVVVTYDSNGFYGHPDHIQAHRITMRAHERTAIARKVYETAVSREEVVEMYTRFRDSGLELDGAEDFDPENPPFGIPREQITTVVDVSDFVDAKRDAIVAHGSQTDSVWFQKIPPDLFRMIFAREAYVRRHDTTNAPLPEDDLFAGLR
jgi:LmbE family N-acetylglucosaminyl deacetylase